MKPLTHYRHTLTKWVPAFASSVGTKLLRINHNSFHSIPILNFLPEFRIAKINFNKYVSLHADSCTIIFHKTYNHNCSKLTNEIPTPKG